MVDFYTDLNNTADELIEEFGRVVNYRARGTFTPTDPDKPWEGTRAAPTVIELSAVFTNFERSAIDGTVIQVGDGMGVVSSVKLGSVIPAIGDEIEDRGTLWRVVDLVDVKPGPQQIVYRLHLRPGRA